METLNIARVARISKNGKGQTINVVVIHTTNGKPNLVRNYAQFLQDMKNSFLIGEQVNSMNHPAVLRVLKGLARGTVSGEIEYSKKGDTWTVTEDSRIITDPTHPQYGSAKVGDKKIVEQDSARIDGFLSIETNSAHQRNEAIAFEMAQVADTLDNVFDDAPVVMAGEEVVDGDVPPDVFASATTTKADSKDKK